MSTVTSSLQLQQAANSMTIWDHHSDSGTIRQYKLNPCTWSESEKRSTFSSKLPSPQTALSYYYRILPQKLPSLPRNSKCMMPADLRGASRVYIFTEVYLASKGTGFKPQGKGCFRVYQNVSIILTGDKPPHNWKKRRHLERYEKIKKWLEKL